MAGEGPALDGAFGSRELGAGAEPFTIGLRFPRAVRGRGRKKLPEGGGIRSAALKLLDCPETEGVVRPSMSCG